MLAQSVEHATTDLRVVRSSPTMEPTYKRKRERKRDGIWDLSERMH